MEAGRLSRGRRNFSPVGQIIDGEQRPLGETDDGWFPGRGPRDKLDPGSTLTDRAERNDRDHATATDSTRREDGEGWTPVKLLMEFISVNSYSWWTMIWIYDFFFFLCNWWKELENENGISSHRERSKDDVVLSSSSTVEISICFLIWKNFNCEVWILNFVHWRNLFWVIGGYKISCAVGEKNCVRKQDTFSTKVYKSKWMMVSFLVLFFIGSFFFINSGNFYLLIGKILITSVWILNFVHWWI